MDKSLLIVGAGQYACVVEEIALSLGYEKICFIDDNSKKAIGTVDKLEELFGEYKSAIVSIGNPQIRKSLTQRLKERGYTVPQLIHPLAYVSPSAVLGCGVIVEPNATVQANATVGEGSIISSGAVLRHNACVGAYCHCDCGAIVTTSACIADLTKVECGKAI